MEESIYKLTGPRNSRGGSLLEKGFLMLLQHPKSDKVRDEIRRGYCSLPVVNHVIFYRIRDKDIEIVRILHQRMEVNQNVF